MAKAPKSQGEAGRWAQCKAGFRKNRNAILRLIGVLLPLIPLLWPAATLTARLPLMGQSWGAGILGLIRMIGGPPEALAFLQSEMGSALFGRVFTLFAAISIMVALAALLGLLIIVFTVLSFFGIKKLAAAVNILGCAGAVLMLGTMISAFLFDRAGAGSDFVEASINFAVPFFSMVLFLFAGFNNRAIIHIKVNQKKWFLRVGIAVLVLAVVGGGTWGVIGLLGRRVPKVSAEEQAILDERGATLKASAPADASEMAEYINAALQYAQEVNPALRLNRAYSLMQAHLDELRFDIPGTFDSIEEGLAGRLRAALALMAPTLADRLNSGFAEQATKEGESITRLLWGMELHGEDIEEPICDYEAYGAGGPWLGEYTITFPFKDGAPGKRSMFRPPAPMDIYDLLAESLAPWAEIADITPQAVRNASIVTVIRAGADKDTPNQLVSQRFSYDLELRVTLKPRGELEPLGGFTVTMAVGGAAEFEFDWPEG